jgi:hypothetical protein
MILLSVIHLQISIPTRLVFRQFWSRIGGWFLAKVLFHPEMDRHNDGNDGNGAEHQNRKQNLNHHRDSGYQNQEWE